MHLLPRQPHHKWSEAAGLAREHTRWPPGTEPKGTEELRYPVSGGQTQGWPDWLTQPFASHLTSSWPSSDPLKATSPISSP